MAQFVWRIVGRGLLGMAVVAALFWAVDWAVWQLRVARGGGFGSVTVTRVVVAPLKGGREEYYGDGTTEERCSVSALGQGGVRACWWVERHRMMWDR